MLKDLIEEAVKVDLDQTSKSVVDKHVHFCREGGYDSGHLNRFLQIPF